MLNSLHGLCSRHRSDTPGRPIVCLLTDALFDLLGGLSGQASGNLSGLSDALDNALKTGRDFTAAEQPCSQARQHVSACIKKAVTGETDSFLGPMCSPFRRAHSEPLGSQAYLVTEKSDGLRVVTLLQNVVGLPKWQEVEASEAPASRGSLCLEHLISVASLERAASALARGATIVEGVHLVEVDSGAEIEYSVTQGREGVFLLSRCLNSAEKIAETASSALPTTLILHRDSTQGKRTMAYCLDRTMDAAYLILCTGQDTLQDGVAQTVVDGELVMAYDSLEQGEMFLDALDSKSADKTSHPHFSPRVCLALFDVFLIRRYDESESVLTHATMSSRYKQLQTLFPLCKAEGHRNAPASVPEKVYLFAKTMWPLSEFSQCLTKVRRLSASQRYWFTGPLGYTLNDGFIFTPEKFPICGGASKTQLKWKWRSLLSVDWLVTASDKSADEYNVFLFFRKKNYGFREDTVGHWRRHKPVRLLNPHSFEVPTDNPVVVECVYDASHQLWSIERLRRDRCEANSVVTVISVFESLAENVTLLDLCSILGLSVQHVVASQTDATADTTSLESLVNSLEPSTAVVPIHESPRQQGDQDSSAKGEAAPAEKRMTAKLGLRAVSTPSRGAKLTLYWVTNTGNPDVKRGIPCELCLVRECAGLGLPCLHTQSTAEENQDASDQAFTLADGEPDTGSAPVNLSCASALEDYLYIELANAGGSCGWSDFVVDAYFDGAAGHWVLVKLHPHGRNSEANFDWILNHLQWLIDHGGGSAAAEALPPSAYGPPATIPKATVAETQLTNEHYAVKSKTLGLASNAASDIDAAARSPRSLQDRGSLRRFNNWIKAVLLKQQVDRVAPTFQGRHAHGEGKEAERSGRACTAPRGGWRGRGHSGGRRGGRGMVQKSDPSGAPPSDIWRLRVADVCCGRGGDLLKWRAVAPAFLYMTDSSFACVAEAAARYSTTKGLSTKATEPGIPAHFAVHDAFDPLSDLKTGLSSFTDDGKHPYHLISCQFALHYGCFSAERLDYFLGAVSSCLAPNGGVFVGTTVNDAELMRRYHERGASFGNSHYHIRFPTESVAALDKASRCVEANSGDREALPFGVRYFATVENSVTELPEYVVPWKQLVAMAGRHGLHVLCDASFSDFADTHMPTSLGQELLKTFAAPPHRKRDRDTSDRTPSPTPASPSLATGTANAPSQGIDLTPEEQEVVSLYRVFILEKRI